MKNKLFLLGAIGLMISSVVTPALTMIVYAEENSFESILENEIETLLNEDINIEDPSVNAETIGDNLIIEIVDGDNQAVIEINGDISDLTSTGDNIQVEIETDSEIANYSVTFASLEDKEKMDLAIQADEVLLDEMENQILSENEVEKLFDENELIETETSEENNDIIEFPTVQLETQKLIDAMPVITTEEELAASDIILTDIASGENISFSVVDGSPSSLALLVGFAITVTGATAASLIKTGAAIVVGGALGFVVTYAKNKTSKKNYSHYAAKMVSGKLVAYKGLKYKAAATLLSAGTDIWSTSKDNALKVSKAASPLGKSTSSELHRKSKTWRFHHFHPAIKKVDGKYKFRGSHSFYGTGVYG